MARFDVGDRVAWLRDGKRGQVVRIHGEREERPGWYVVRFEDGATHELCSYQLRRLHGTVDRRWQHA
ncbi:MAG: hypothetical protein WC683_18275 [bacterium]